MSSTTRLLDIAKLWAKANSRSLSRLATIVANDGKLFDRLEGGGSCTLATFDRFIAYFRDATNWRDGIPEDALQLINSPVPAA